jgi:hypothetical protein
MCRRAVEDFRFVEYWAASGPVDERSDTVGMIE